MSVNLIYKHQQKTYELMKEELSKGKRVAYVFPTGCGKSFPALKYIEENPNKRILLVSSGLETIHQFQTYIQQYILESKDKLTKRQFPNFRAITYQKITLSTNICDLYPDVIILDEIHRMGAEEWGPAIDKLLSTFPDAEVVGMSATPERTDKRNMAYEKFDSVVYEMSLTEALSGEKENEVVLNGARYVRDLSQLRKLLPRYRQQIEKIGDKQEKEELLAALKRLEEITENAPTTQDIMVDAMQKKNGKYLVFCSNREEMFKKMKMVQEIFGKVNSNIQIDYVITRYNGTGKSKAENRRTIETFEKREDGETLNLLFCIDMLNEGIHLKGISGAVMFRPTESAIVYKQQIGRVLTSKEQKEQTVIVDVANNWIRQAGAFQELQQAALRGTKISGKKGIIIEEGKNSSNAKQKEKLYNIFAFNPKDLEVLNILESLQERLWYNNQSTYEQIVQWLEEHDGKMPRSMISKCGKILSRKEMTQEEKDEVNLHARWLLSPEYKAFKDCRDIPIEEIPPEYEPYKEKIATLRRYGYAISKKSVYEQIIQWLEEHDGIMPRANIYNKGKKKPVQKLTQQEHEEINLYKRWYKTPESVALRKCEGTPLDELPAEYMQYREKISILRELTRTERPNIYEEIIEWLESHNGKSPRSIIYRQGKVLTRKEMTREQRYEINLYLRWNYSKGYEIYRMYQEVPLEQIPAEYEQYKELIVTLRRYGYRIIIKSKKTVYEQITEWLEEHNGKMPRSGISKCGKVLSRKEMTQEEKYGTSLYVRWVRTPEYKAFKECRDIPMEEIPLEYQQYREQIATLRRYEQMRKDNKLRGKMKKSVAKQVKNNESTRAELTEIVVQQEKNGLEIE